MNFNLYSLDVDYKKRVYGLDIIRAFAIIQVVIIHGNSILGNLNTEFPWIRLVEGVEVFFVLSGFLIGSMLIATFEKQGLSFNVITQFLKRRWFRTLPNYYLILLINIIIVYTGIIREDFSQFNYRFFLFIQNFRTPFYGFFWESWSLSIEEWFYLLFPALALALVLFFKKFKIKHLVLLMVCLFISVPFLLRIYELHNEDLWVNNGIRIKGIVIYKLDAIAFGVLGAWIKAYYQELWNKYKNILFFSGLLLLYIYMYADKHNFTMALRIFNNSIISFLILLLFPKADSIKQGSGWFLKIVTHISLISYSMYLLNLAVICEVITNHFMSVKLFSSVALYIVYWFLVITLSTILYKFYEKPMMSLRDK